MHRVLIKRHVFLFGGDETETWVSCFRAAVREARVASGRDPDTGKIRDNDCACCDHQPTEWAGVLMYLVLLEQIGKVLRPVGSRASPRRKNGKTRPREQDIARALRYFGARWINPREREVLVALRNAFAHDFGLTHKWGKNPRRRHKFALTVSDTAPLVKFPKEPWNGHYDKRDRGGATVVNLTRFTRDAERIIRRIESDARNGTLRLATEITPAELDTRFAFRILNPTAAK